MLSGRTSDKDQSHSGDQGGRRPNEEKMRGEELVTVNRNKSFAKFW